jgi:hypothetical protein
MASIAPTLASFASRRVGAMLAIVLNYKDFYKLLWRYDTITVPSMS